MAVFKSTSKTTPKELADETCLYVNTICALTKLRAQLDGRNLPDTPEWFNDYYSGGLDAAIRLLAEHAAAPAEGIAKFHEDDDAAA